MPTTSRKLAKRKPEAQSRVTNGKEVLPGVDGRSLIARRFRDVADAVAADQGGADHLSETRLQLIRRFAASAVVAEQMEAQLALGHPIDVATHSTLTSTMVRVAQRIGINRKAREVLPSLESYLKGKLDEDEEDET